MSTLIRSVFVGCLALIATLAATSAATAVTVTPSGAYTASSGSTILRFNSNGQALTCTSSSIGATISSNGNGTVPAGSARFNGCNNALLGNFTVTQSSAWSLTLLLSRLINGNPPVVIGILVGELVTIPTRGITITGGGCSFTVSGIALLGQLRSQATLPFVYSDPIILRADLRVDSVSGCSPLLTVVGLTATYSSTYRLSRPATVSG